MIALSLYYISLQLAADNHKRDLSSEIYSFIENFNPQESLKNINKDMSFIMMNINDIDEDRMKIFFYQKTSINDLGESYSERMNKAKNLTTFLVAMTEKYKSDVYFTFIKILARTDSVYFHLAISSAYLKAKHHANFPFFCSQIEANHMDSEFNRIMDLHDLSMIKTPDDSIAFYQLQDHFSDEKFCYFFQRIKDDEAASGLAKLKLIYLIQGLKSHYVNNNRMKEYIELMNRLKIIESQTSDETMKVFIGKAIKNKGVAIREGANPFLDARK